MKRALKVERYNFNMVVINNPDKANVLHLKLNSKQNNKQNIRNNKNLNQKENKFNVKNPEAGLWKAVIMQAVLDIMSSSKRASEILAKQTARDWFSEKNKNFLQVCSYASLDPAWVIKKVKHAIENPRMWRRECDLKNFFANKKNKD